MFDQVFAGFFLSKESCLRLNKQIQRFGAKPHLAPATVWVFCHSGKQTLATVFGE